MFAMWIGRFAEPRGLVSAVVLLLSMIAASWMVSQQANAQTTAPEVGSVFRDCPDCPEMVVIPAGNFLMGSSPDEAARDIEAAPISDTSSIRKLVLAKQPQHEITIKQPFALAKFPVTKSEFGTFVEETKYTPAPGCFLHSLQYHESSQASWQEPGFVQIERDPVVCVNWQDAKAYVAWLNKKLASSINSENDEPYRLPSEAEWEYAARAGTRTARWWGDGIGKNNTVCDRCGSKWDLMQPAPVGSFHSNPFGLYDLLGNVSQWTGDCWNENYTGGPIDDTPRATGNCERRVGRGGNWANLPWVIRSATRSGLSRENRVDVLGFRVAKTLNPTSR
jgi:formylglycine-generating enzyme required for sulfatase activity